MAETYDAKIFQRDGVAMVLYPDGDEAVLADVMRYMNPGSEFDQATGLQMAATPPPAESATYSQSTVREKPFGSVAANMAEPYMSQAYDALTRAPVVDPNSYVPESVQRINQTLGNTGSAALSGLLGMIYGGAGLAGDAVNAVGIGGGQRLANDLAGMVDVAGVGPEARMVEMLSNAGAGRSIARTVAERANQRGPVPTMGSNFANLLGDTLPAPRNEAEAIAKNILELRATGNVDAVTEGMMSAADPQYMYNYTPLPMDQASRMARAGDIGFPRDDWYHGTNQDISGFRGNTFTADNPTLASTYARGITDAQTYPLLLRSKFSTTPVDAGGQLWSQIPIQAINDPAVASWLDPNALQSTRSIESAAVNEGRSGVRFKDVLDIGPGFDSQQFKRAGYSPDEAEAMRLEYLRQLDTPATVDVRLSPNQIRSRFARFDPMFAHLRNLSAGVAISPLAYGLLSDQYEREQRQ